MLEGEFILIIVQLINKWFIDRVWNWCCWPHTIFGTWSPKTRKCSLDTRAAWHISSRWPASTPWFFEIYRDGSASFHLGFWMKKMMGVFPTTCRIIPRWASNPGDRVRLQPDWLIQHFLSVGEPSPETLGPVIRGMILQHSQRCSNGWWPTSRSRVWLESPSLTSAHFSKKNSKGPMVWFQRFEQWPGPPSDHPTRGTPFVRDIGGWCEHCQEFLFFASNFVAKFSAKQSKYGRLTQNMGSKNLDLVWHWKPLESECCFLLFSGVAPWAWWTTFRAAWTNRFCTCNMQELPNRAEAAWNHQLNTKLVVFNLTPSWWFQRIKKISYHTL